MPTKTKPKKELGSSYTDFKIMLYVDPEGKAEYFGADGYFDAISKCEQRKGYCMQGNREEDMRKEFDRQKNLPAPKAKSKKRDAVDLEKQYGSLVRNLYKFKGVDIEQLAKQFKLEISDVRTMVKER